jgi:hypothetical protein
VYGLRFTCKRNVTVRRKALGRLSCLFLYDSETRRARAQTTFSSLALHKTMSDPSGSSTPGASGSGSSKGAPITAGSSRPAADTSAAPRPPPAIASLAKPAAAAGMTRLGATKMKFTPTLPGARKRAEVKAVRRLNCLFSSARLCYVLLGTCARECPVDPRWWSWAW